MVAGATPEQIDAKSAEARSQQFWDALFDFQKWAAARTERNPGWETEYCDWPALRRATKRVLEIPLRGHQDLMYVLARDNESGLVLELLAEQPERSTKLARWALDYGCDEPEARWQLAVFLGQQDTEEAETLLRRLVEDPDEYVRKTALLASAAHDRAYAERTAIDWIGDPNEHVRLAALTVLAEVDSEHLPSALRQLEKDPSEIVRDRANELQAKKPLALDQRATTRVHREDEIGLETEPRRLPATSARTTSEGNVWDLYWSVWKKARQFSGRANRREYWTFALINAGLFVIPSFILGSILGDLSSVAMIPISLFLLAAIVPSIAVAVRRLHDRNLSGWVLLIALIPLLGPLALFVVFLLPGTHGETRRQSAPDPPGIDRDHADEPEVNKANPAGQRGNEHAGRTSTKRMQSVISNFLGTYTSRYSDWDGYWLFGFLVGAFQWHAVDLIATPSTSFRNNPLDYATALAQRKFIQQLVRNRIPSEHVANATLDITPYSRQLTVFEDSYRRVVGGLQLRVQVEMLGGETLEEEWRIVVRPHDPTRELRRRVNDRGGTVEPDGGNWNR